MEGIKGNEITSFSYIKFVRRFLFLHIASFFFSVEREEKQA